MKAILTALGVIAGIAGFGALVGYKNRVVPAGAVGITPTVLLHRILAIFGTQNAGAMNTQAKFAAEGARALGLPKTAAGILAMAYPATVYPLPTDETWPGTNQSVRAFIDGARAKK